MLVYINCIVFLPMAAGLISYLMSGRYKKKYKRFADIIAGVTFIFCALLCIQVLNGTAKGAVISFPLSDSLNLGMRINFTLDGFRALYGTIAAFMWFMATLFSREYFKHYRSQNRYYLFLLLTLGATEGVFFSADFYTTFLFFEMMSFTSYVWVVHDEKPESMRAGATYLTVAVLGGLVMLMGIFLLYDAAGTLLFSELAQMSLCRGENAAQIWAAGLCLLFGFGAKAGAFPLHIWLPKAHPVAPAPASALLSGMLTKTGVFGILVLTGYLFAGSLEWGTLLLLLGVCTMVMGAVLALFSVDLKRTLACSSVSQIGFILVGIGMCGLLGEDGGIAVRGSLLHMVNHSLIKLVLFLAAGVVYRNVHKLDLNDIRGFGRKKPLLNYIFLMGALGIGGVPLWNGYVSKTLIHEAIIEYTKLLENGVTGILSVSAIKGIEWAFLASGGLTIAYMAKWYVAIFIEKNNDSGVQQQLSSLKGVYMDKGNSIVLAISATLLPVMGMLPSQVMGRLADMGQGFLFVTRDVQPVNWFSAMNLKGAAISIGMGIIIYLTVVRLWMIRRKEGVRVYVNRWDKRLDLEELVYRPVLAKLLPFIMGILCRMMDSLVDGIVVRLRKTIYKDSKLPCELEEGTVITHTAGSFVNGLERIGNATIWHRHPKKVDYRHKYALIYQEWSEDSTIIGRSLSFGLLLFCAGLILTVVYLLV